MSSRTKPILLAAALAAFPLTAAATYIVTDLGTLSGTYSQGHSINDSGQVVGNSSTSVGNRAFLYSGGGMTNLGTLGTGTESNALAINNSGQVAGWSYITGTFQQRAFLYSGGTMTNLGTLVG
jgi:probable HAF family extracellular repeat protein